MTINFLFDVTRLEDLRNLQFVESVHSNDCNHAETRYSRWFRQRANGIN